MSHPATTPQTTLSRHPVDVHLGPDDLRETMRRDVSEGLGASPRSVPSTYFYDARGSDLFVDITRLPEY